MTTSHLGHVDIRKVPVFIYALAEPTTGEVRYVGKSQNPRYRISSHASRSGAPLVREWIASLRADGAEPALVILYEVSAGHDADPWEDHFLTVHKSARLLNTVGPGGAAYRQWPSRKGAS